MRVAGKALDGNVPEERDEIRGAEGAEGVRARGREGVDAAAAGCVPDAEGGDHRWQVVVVLACGRELVHVMPNASRG